MKNKREEEKRTFPEKQEKERKVRNNLEKNNKVNG